MPVKKPRPRKVVTKKVATTRRQRRSTGEIVTRLIDAACDEFEANGYSGTTTAAIARRAGVAEALLFSNFGSKAKLFHDSMFKPLNQHFVDFRATHRIKDGDANSMRAGTQQYIHELRQFIERHAGMLMSLVVAQTYGAEDVEGVSKVQGLYDYFAHATTATTRFGKKSKLDAQITARVSFATVLACVLFKDWLFPEGFASNKRLNDAISNFVIDGLNASSETT